MVIVKILSKYANQHVFLMVKYWQILTLIMNQGFLPLRLWGLFWQKHFKACVRLVFFIKKMLLNPKPYFQMQQVLKSPSCQLT